MSVFLAFLAGALLGGAATFVVMAVLVMRGLRALVAIGNAARATTPTPAPPPSPMYRGRTYQTAAPRKES